MQPTRAELEILSYLLDDVESTSLLLESLEPASEVDDRLTVHSYLVGLASRGLVRALSEVRTDEGNALEATGYLPTVEQYDADYWWEITDRGRDFVELR